MQNNTVLDMFRRAGGYLPTSQLIRNKVHTLKIRQLVDQGAIEQVKRGLYRLPSAELPSHNYFTHDYFDAAIAAPAGVFCLATALYYHDLTTTIPNTLEMALPPSHRGPQILTVAMHYYHFQEPYYSLDVQYIDTPISTIAIYGPEKSICDAVRLRHFIGEDLGMESLNTYIRKPQKDINTLLQITRQCKVNHIVEPAVKAMVGY